MEDFVTGLCGCYQCGRVARASRGRCHELLHRLSSCRHRVVWTSARCQSTDRATRRGNSRERSPWWLWLSPRRWKTPERCTTHSLAERHVETVARNMAQASAILQFEARCRQKLACRLEDSWRNTPGRLGPTLRPVFGSILGWRAAA